MVDNSTGRPVAVTYDLSSIAKRQQPPSSFLSPATIWGFGQVPLVYFANGIRVYGYQLCGTIQAPCSEPGGDSQFCNMYGVWSTLQPSFFLHTPALQFTV